ncbi:MAG: GTP-binding protein [Candelina mexicana]|nr:MAG: GTP-binding protein [Candelina mexicana]
MTFICKSCARRLSYTKRINRRGLTIAASTTNTTILPPPLSTTTQPLPSTPPNKPTFSSPTSRPSQPLIPPSALSYHWDTQPPTPTQLTSASRFFITNPPCHLYTASHFRTIPTTSSPEVAFLGRSNVGKSSLLNALLGKKICYTSSKPGRTRAMNAFGVGGVNDAGGLGGGFGGGLVVLDMPGYGKGGREEWGKEILKYLVGRRQYVTHFPAGKLSTAKSSGKSAKLLRRAFLLIDAVHGIKRTDEQLLAILRQNAIPHQIIVSKVDRILLPKSRVPSEEKTERNLAATRKMLKDMKPIVQPGSNEGPGALGEILTCSAEKSVERGKKLGIDRVRWAVLSAAGLENYSSTRSRAMPISSSKQQEMVNE